MLVISWKNEVRNEEVRKKIAPQNPEIIKRKRPRWFGLALRMDDGRLTVVTSHALRGEHYKAKDEKYRERTRLTPYTHLYRYILDAVPPIHVV